MIDDLFDLLSEFDFVGAHITGMVDDSIVGHIANELDLNDEERTLSGGFMVFDPQAIKIPFTNFYNEDWIWLFLQAKGKKIIQTGNVIQSKYDPFLNYQSKIIFQEFGEILLSGVSKVYNENSFEKLTQRLFWRDILNERKKYLKKLTIASERQGLENYSTIIQHIQNNYSNFNTQSFQNTFKIFWNDVAIFHELNEKS